MQVDPQAVIQHLSNEVSRLTLELAVAKAAIEQLQASIPPVPVVEEIAPTENSKKQPYSKNG